MRPYDRVFNVWLAFMACISCVLKLIGCPSGWPDYSLWTSKGKVCFKFVVGNRVDFDSAMRMCRSDGGDLVSLTSAEKLIYVNGIRALHYRK